MIFFLNLIFILKTSPLFIILNSYFLSFSGILLGPIILWRLTIIFYIFSLLDLIYLLWYLLYEDIYIFYTLGKLYFISDILDIQFLFCCDILSVITSSLVIFLGILTIQFSIEYMYREFQINYLLIFLTLFISMIILLFYAFDVTLIVAAWESIGLLSYILVNYYKGRIFTIKSAFKTFLYSRISDVFLFIFYILITYEFNTTNLSNIFLLIPFYMYHEICFYNITLHFLSVLSFCVFIAASIKAAQFWWHVWLPDAMDAPTPASALIHSSTLVIMGIYVLLRFSILLEFTFLINIIFALYGSLTIALGALSAICQTDLKKLIAYSTISQIGYLFLGCGFCCFNEVLLYLIMHALNKATLFILAGYIIHFFNGNTDMRFMGGVSNLLFDFCVMIFIIWLNLSGFPWTLGFFAKEFLLCQCLNNDLISFLTFIGLTVSFFCTPIYTFLILTKVCFGYMKALNFVFFTNYVYKNSNFLKHLNFLYFKQMCINLKYCLTPINTSGFISSCLLFIIILTILFVDDALINILYSIISTNNLFFFGNYLTTLPHYNILQNNNLNNLLLITINKLILIILVCLGNMVLLLTQKSTIHGKLKISVCINSILIISLI